MNLYALFDPLAKESGPLWQAKNDQVAIRQAKSLLADMKLKVSDFELLCFGEYYADENPHVIVYEEVRKVEVPNEQ